MDFKKPEEKKHKAVFHWPNSEEAWVELSHVSDSEVAKIRKSCTIERKDFTKDPDKKKMVRVDSLYFDEEKFINKYMDTMWTGLGGFSIEGKELECTLENKKMLLEVEEFASFYIESQQAFFEDCKKMFGGNDEAKN